MNRISILSIQPSTWNRMLLSGSLALNPDTRRRGMYLELLYRFLIGGAIVTAFSLLGDIFHPKSFAGLFGAAPSVALATLVLCIASDGKAYAALETRSMIAGGIAFFVYATAVGRIMMHAKTRALWTALALIPVWAGCALSLWLWWWR